MRRYKQYCELSRVFKKGFWILTQFYNWSHEYIYSWLFVAWNETYRGIVPDKILDRMYLNEKERTNNSIQKFNEKENHQFVLEVNNKIVGYMNVGISDDKEYEKCGEIHAIYIIGGYKGYGYGRKMIDAGIQELKSMNCDKMLIGCLVGNPTNEFYKHIGGKYIKQRIFEKLQLPENVYYFDKI